MKIARKNVLLSAVIIALVICVCCVMHTDSQPRLTDEQIRALRDEYPVCGKSVPPTVSMKPMTVDKVKNYAETFVYGEVAGEMSTYNVTAGLKNSELAEKRKQSGIDDTFEFYEYTISVIEDTEGIYSEGEEITIAANIDFINYNPTLSDGMRIVVPTVRDKKKEGRTHYTVNGMYYVTPDGYAIAAFDEEKASASKGVSSGVKVEALLKKLKK